MAPIRACSKPHSSSVQIRPVLAQTKKFRCLPSEGLSGHLALKYVDQVNEHVSSK